MLVRASQRGRAIRRSAPAGRSLRTLLLALAVLCAQGVAQLHLLLVAHATCEHGELIEIGAGTREAAHRALLPIRPRSDVPEVSASNHQRGHDHCDALGVRHDLPAVAPTVAAFAVFAILPTPEGFPGSESRPIPLLSLAPKSSPPA